MADDDKSTTESSQENVEKGPESTNEPETELDEKLPVENASTSDEESNASEVEEKESESDEENEDSGKDEEGEFDSEEQGDPPAQEKPTLKKQLLGFGIAIAVICFPIVMVLLIFSKFSLSNPETYTGFKEPVISVAISPEGKYLAACSKDNTIRIWSMQTAEEVWTITERKPDTNALAFASNGILLTGDNVLACLWDVENKKKLGTLDTKDGWFQDVEVSPDGKLAATCRSKADDNVISLWDLKTSKRIRKLDAHTRSVTCLAFSPDSKQLLSAAGKELFVWEVSSGDVVQKWQKAHDDTILTVAFHPKEAGIVASAGMDKVVRLRKIGSEEIRKELKGHAKHIESITFSPDGVYLVSGSRGSTAKERKEQSVASIEKRPIRVWKLDYSSEWLHVIDFDIGITGVTFSADGQHLIAGGVDNLVYVWKMP